MSLLSNILGLTDQEKEESVIHPCPNCESSCGVYPDACEECKPYKEKLTDALYNVANIDAFYDRYEVILPGSAPVGVTVCPICGAPLSSYVCEYCGSRIAGTSGKIQVDSANDIPNPIIEARDLIYGRRAVTDRYSGEAESGSQGLLGSIVSALTGDDGEKESSLGSAMTEAEIKAMAEKYNVSVRDYLEGLDMGTYLSKDGWEEQQSSYAAAAAPAAVTGMMGGGQPRPPKPQSIPHQPEHGPIGRPDMVRPQTGHMPKPNQSGFRQESSRPAAQGGRPAQHGPHGNGRTGGGPGGKAPSGRR